MLRPSRRMGNLTSQEPTMFWILKSCGWVGSHTWVGNQTYSGRHDLDLSWSTVVATDGHIYGGHAVIKACMRAHSDRSLTDSTPLLAATA